MKRWGSRERPQPGVFVRVAVATCPPRERRWVEAMFAELSAIEGSGRRLDWVMGAWSVVIALLSARLASVVSTRFRWAAVVAALGAGLFGAGSAIDYQGLGIDDDVLLALAAASGTLALSLGVLVLVDIIRDRAVHRLGSSDADAGASGGLA